MFSILLLPAGATAPAIQLAALHLKRQNCFSLQRKIHSTIFELRKHADFNGCSEFEAKLNCTCSPCIWQACPAWHGFCFRIIQFSLHSLHLQFPRKTTDIRKLCEKRKSLKQDCQKTQCISSCRTQILISRLTVCKILQFPVS